MPAAPSEEPEIRSWSLLDQMVLVLMIWISSVTHLCVTCIMMMNMIEETLETHMNPHRSPQVVEDDSRNKLSSPIPHWDGSLSGLDPSMS